MTNYSAGPGDAQAKINALLPGDVLTLNAGTYGALTVAVNGSPANEIKILGSIHKNGTHEVLINGGAQALTITGSYLHIEGLDISNATRSVVFSAASHVKLRNVTMIYGVNEGIWIKANSHHIFVWHLSIGSTDLPANNFTIGVRVGTPNASWTNANTPDRTHDVHIFDGKINWNPGWGVQVCEGAHHVLVEDINHDSSSGPDNRPPAGSANGDGNFNSRGDDAHFLRCWGTAPTVNYFRCDRITVGGVTYGLRQVIKGGGGRPFGITDPENYDPNLYFEAVKSNTDDLMVYRNFFNVYQVVFPGYDATGGTWPAHGWLVSGDQYKKLDIGGPARGYRIPNETLPYGQFNPMVDLNWTVGGAVDTAPDVAENTFGTEFVVDKPSGWLVGYAYYRVISACAPTEAQMYRLEPRWPANTTVPKIEDFETEAEWVAAVTAWGEWYTPWLNNNPDYINYHVSLPVVETFKMVTPPGTLVKQGWTYVYLDAPYPLIENYHYMAAMYFPTNTTPSGHKGHTIGVGFWDFWGRSYGCNGLRQGPVVIPAMGQTGQIISNPQMSGFDNRPGNITTRQFTTQPARSVAYLHRLIGQLISFPDIGFPLGEAVSIAPLVSFARVIPEIITVTPDMDLQEILDTRIPGDTVIISGLHVGEFTMRESGTLTKPIHVKGDGTAVLRYRFGQMSFLPAFRVKASYIWLSNIIFEHGRNGVLVENFVTGVRVETCTARSVRDEGFAVQEDSSDVCFINCIAYDTGLGKVVGDGFRVGRHAGNWIQDGHPDVTERVLIENCQVYRNFGTGISACDGATQVVIKNCSVDFTQGNAPAGLAAGLYYDPPAGYFSRADQVQIIGCTVTGAPGAGFLMMDSQWRPNTTNYGRLIEIKGGSSTGHGDAGVVSQSEGLKVYADFTATPAPRLREIEGGWSAAGGSVATTGFRELVFNSISQHFPPNETE